MGESYEFSFKNVSRLCGITTQKLVADRVITEREANLIDEGRVKAVRLSTLGRICEATDCSPGDFFVVKRSRPDDKE